MTKHFYSLCFLLPSDILWLKKTTFAKVRTSSHTTKGLRVALYLSTLFICHVLGHYHHLMLQRQRYCSITEYSMSDHLIISDFWGGLVVSVLLTLFFFVWWVRSCDGFETENTINRLARNSIMQNWRGTSIWKIKRDVCMSWEKSEKGTFDTRTQPGLIV